MLDNNTQIYSSISHVHQPRNHSKNPFCPVKHHLIAKITTLLQQTLFVNYLSRQKKFVDQFIMGLIKSRNMSFGKVAQHLNDDTKPAPNETRIQDFFSRSEPRLLVGS